MDSLGEKIKKHREEKGYSLDQVARDTHITKKFLEALEDENYSTLPGESYVIGFLRSYSEYLGLNTDEILSMYKNMRLQEQPPPMEELLVKPGLSQRAKVIIVGGAILLVGVVGLIIAGSSKNIQKPAVEEPKVVDSKEAITFDGKVLERTFVDGSRIIIPLVDSSHEGVLNYKDGEVSFTVDKQKIVLTLNKGELLDLNNDKNPDIRMIVRSVDTRTNPVKLVMRVDRDLTATIPLATDASSETTLAVTGDLSLGQPAFSSRAQKPLVFGTTTQKQPLSASLILTNANFFRIETDAGKRIERYGSKGETIELTSQNWVRVSVIDGARALVRAMDKEYNLGTRGEVSTWQLMWAGPDSTGNYQLQLVPVY